MLTLRTLLADEAHVWIAALDVLVETPTAVAATLSADERERAAGFRFEWDRRRFVAARAISRRILGEHYLGREPAALTFAYGPNGKPALILPEAEGRSSSTAPAAGDLQFNLAHADDLALVAVAQGRRVGVDLERVRPLPDLPGLAATVLTVGERAVLQRVPEDDRVRAFLQIWTRKEAFLKATGEGLSRAPGTIEVAVRPGEPARLLAVDGDSAAPAIWSMRDVEIPAGYVGALVVEGPAPRLRILRVTLAGDSERDS